MGFVHVTLAVADMEKSLAFYRDLLKMPVGGQMGQPGDPFRITFLGAGDVKLELIQGNGLPKSAESVSIGFVPENLEEVLEACRDTAQGPISPNPHATFWFVRDPDGYRVQVMAPGH